MKNFKSIFIIVILCLISLVFLLKTEKTNKTEQFVRRKDALLRLIKNSTEIHRIWLEGEDSREWGLVRNQCLKKYNITESFDESLLRCRPMLLECINEFLPKKLFNIINNKSDMFSYQFTLEDSDTHEKLEVSLNNKCHELYLEQGIYAYGEAPKHTNCR